MSRRAAAIEEEVVEGLETVHRRRRTRPANSVTIVLDPDVYIHFEAEAREDDRELDKYLARVLRFAYRDAVAAQSS